MDKKNIDLKFKDLINISNIDININSKNIITVKLDYINAIDLNKIDILESIINSIQANYNHTYIYNDNMILIAFNEIVTKRFYRYTDIIINKIKNIIYSIDLLLSGIVFNVEIIE